MAENNHHVFASQQAYSRVGSPFGARRSFSFPHEVVDDPSLNQKQKRAILCEWASDASAIESLPTLRLLAGTTMPVTLSAVFDALRQLDMKYGYDSGSSSESSGGRKVAVTKVALCHSGGDAR